LPLVPPGAVLPGAWDASEAGEDVEAAPGTVRALGLVLEPGWGLWCPLLEPIQHELTDHINGGPLRGRMDAVEEWITTAKATSAANSHWLNRLWAAFGLRGRSARQRLSESHEALIPISSSSS
jgi:hypothetical protein